MERGLRDLEEEIQMLKSNGALSSEEREEEMKQMEVYRSHSKFMKNKVWSGFSSSQRPEHLCILFHVSVSKDLLYDLIDLKVCCCCVSHVEMS
jgi:hypothetical protein